MSRLQAAGGSRLSSPDLLKLKYYLINTLSRELESEGVPADKREEFASQRLDDIYQRANLRLPDDIRKHIFKEVNDELFGFGPIQGLLADPDVTEVMVNGPKNIYVEKKGVLTKASVMFEDDDRRPILIPHLAIYLTPGIFHNKEVEQLLFRVHELAAKWGTPYFINSSVPWQNQATYLIGPAL